MAVNPEDIVRIGRVPDITIRRRNEAQFFTIERLMNLEPGSYRYRIIVRLAGDEELGRDVEIDERMSAEEIRFKLEHAVQATGTALVNMMQEQLARAFHVESGIYDNTGTLQRGEAMREAIDNDVLRVMEAEANLFARNALSRLYGFRVITPGEFFASPDDTQGKRKKVQDKAMKLLAHKIGWRKMRSLKKKGYFEEQGGAGVYRFYLNDSGGVKLLQTQVLGGKKRTLEWDLCIQSAVADMPKADIILARWLEWRADEERFLATANFRNIRTTDEALSRPILSTTIVEDLGRIFPRRVFFRPPADTEGVSS